MNLEEIRERLKHERMTDVCAAVGISRQALWLIKAGKTKNPSARVLDALRDYLGKSCS
jgi:transcriptional regulator with XRE-family HTH domain